MGDDWLKVMNAQTEAVLEKNDNPPLKAKVKRINNNGTIDVIVELPEQEMPWEIPDIPLTNNLKISKGDYVTVKFLENNPNSPVIDGMFNPVSNNGDGEDGRSILSVDKVETDGLIDIYRITYSKPPIYSYFQIINGDKGELSSIAISNLNEAISTGFYNCYSAENAPSDGFFTIEVNTDENNVIQTATNPNGIDYHRIGYDVQNNLSWSNWVEKNSGGDLSNKADKFVKNIEYVNINGTQESANIFLNKDFESIKVNNLNNDFAIILFLGDYTQRIYVYNDSIEFRVEGQNFLVKTDGILTLEEIKSVYTDPNTLIIDVQYIQGLNNIDILFGYKVENKLYNLEDVYKEIRLLKEEITAELIERDHPPGSPYFSFLVDDDPNDRFPGTTWVRIEENTYLVSAGSNLVGMTPIGNNTKTLTVSNLPNHNHGGSISSVSLTTNSDTHDHLLGESGSILSTEVASRALPGTGTGFGGISRRTSSNSHNHSINSHNHSLTIGFTGSGDSFDNRPKSLAIYMWRRIA